MSPLVETLRAVSLLARPGRASVNLPWVRWARAELERRPLRLPRVWPLLVSDRLWWPEFLFPAPTGKSPALAEELARVCATPTEAVHVSLRNVFGDDEWPKAATDLFERPQETLAEIAAEVAECHDRLIAPHWERLRSVLDADIAYRGGMLAAGGARSLFADLHPNVRWSAGRLLLSDSETVGGGIGGPGHAGFGRPGADAERVHLAGVVGEQGHEYSVHAAVPGAGGRHGVAGGRGAGFGLGGARGGRGAARRAAGQAARRAAVTGHH